MARIIAFCIEIVNTSSTGRPGLLRVALALQYPDQRGQNNHTGHYDNYFQQGETCFFLRLRILCHVINSLWFYDTTGISG